MKYKLSIDFETRSRANLPDCGAYRYAEHPSTEVLVVAVSINGTQPVTWDIREPIEGNVALGLLRRGIEEGWEIHAYNSQFEWAILKYVCPRQFGFPIPDINNLRCTMALCRIGGLPPSLAKAAEFLQLPVQKDKMGKALIQKFSLPQKKDGGRFIEWSDDVTFTVGGEKLSAGDAFQRFVDYCATDVRTEVAVQEAMTPFELKGTDLDYFLLDARLNDRGVPVHRQALTNAYALYREHETNLVKEFQGITGLMPSQTARTKEWLQARGYKGNSLNVESREKFGNDPSLSPEAKRALDIRAELSFAAVKKIPTMLEWIMDDDFIRGSFMFAGAQKTWRWTAKGPQWQNLKKAAKPLRPIIETIFQDVAKGIDLEMLDWCYGNPYEIIASLSRYFVRYKGEKMFDSDFAQVEAKILPFLIECQRILDGFGSEDGDLYIKTWKAVQAAMGRELNRDMGKTLVLATQFGGGWRAVFTATGKTWPRGDCEKVAATIRKENPEFPKAWTLFQDKFIEALDNPGKWIEVTPYISYAYSRKAPFPRMYMRLPDGRKICMPLPEKSPITMVKVVTKKLGEKAKSSEWVQVPGHYDREILSRKMKMGDEFFNPNKHIESSFWTWEISFYGHIENNQYGRVKSYGGDQLQTATQATGVILLSQGALRAEREGFTPFFLVHDQCLAPAIGDKDQFTRALCNVPEWFKGFPLSADTDIVRSYQKS